MVAGVRDETACRKGESRPVNPSLSNALERVAPLGWDRNVLGFYRASPHARSIRLAEVQLAAQRLTRDTG